MIFKFKISSQEINNFMKIVAAVNYLYLQEGTFHDGNLQFLSYYLTMENWKSMIFIRYELLNRIAEHLNMDYRAHLAGIAVVITEIPMLINASWM